MLTINKVEFQNSKTKFRCEFSKCHENLSIVNFFMMQSFA